jgi:hypothetical protein
MPYIQLQFRRDTSQNWTATNPLLASGEMGIELDTHTFKIGDGSSHWNNLPYGGLQGPAGPAGLIPPSATAPGQVLTFLGPSSSDIAWRNPNLLTKNRAIIKASQYGTNFDFINANVTLPTTFGSQYTPGIIVPPATIPAGTTDTTGFVVLLSTNYNMVNLPMLMGTIMYWDGQKINYMQIKFGNSNTTNAVRATIVPGNLTSRDSQNIPTYGAPLQLRIDGISSAAFNGVSNISLTTPLNYAIAIYLEIMN